MKKLLFVFCVNCLMAVGAMAQNSLMELQQTSKAESFMNNTSFYKEIEVSKYSDNGLELYGRVFVNLKNESERYGAIEFRTESKMARAFWTALAVGMAAGPNATAAVDDGRPRPLGYLDFDEINSLISALKKISDATKGKSSNDFTINYIAPGGINVYYTYEDGAQKMFFRKAWYSTNKFGTSEVSYITSDEINAKKNVDEIIKAISDTKSKIETELNK